MPETQVTAISTDEGIAQDMTRFYNDPLGYVYYAFPWGQKGTRLEEFDGPDKWQIEVLNYIGEQFRLGKYPVQVAIASGHGIGKGALCSWITKWFNTCRAFPLTTVTSNTKAQLLSKTWRELAKWNGMAIDGHWFEWTATTFYFKDPQKAATWKAFAMPWSEQNSEAFAGTHEENVCVQFDEASAVADIIWEVTEGAMTQPGSIWVVLGNPTKTTGRFRECFGKYKHRWKTFQIDSRTAKMTEKKQLERWIEDYGEDSDFVRVRVKGQFPRTSSSQYIGSDIVEEAARRNYEEKEYQYAPIIIGGDPARFGDDQSCIVVRQGLQMLEIYKYRELSTMDFASFIAEVQDKYRHFPVYTFVDVVGIGAGVCDRLTQMGRFVQEVNAGARSTDNKYFNKRAQMYGDTRDWLAKGGAIIDDVELKDDLCGPHYGYNTKMKVQIERKVDMKSRGLSSPDCGEALIHTFAFKVNMLEGNEFTEDNRFEHRQTRRTHSRTGY